MILNLVDRRTSADGTSPEFHGSRWERLGRLAAGIGDPGWTTDVVLVDDDVMIDLNGRYRSRDEVTDILSFSYLEAAGCGKPDLVRGQRHAATDIWLAAVGDASAEAEPAAEDAGEAAVGVVGELILAPGFVGRRCAENGWPLAEEIPLLVVHGCLHLLGWDHENPAEGRAMQDIEANILAGEGLPHPLRQRS